MPCTLVVDRTPPLLSISVHTFQNLACLWQLIFGDDPSDTIQVPNINNLLQWVPGVSIYSISWSREIQNVMLLPPEWRWTVPILGSNSHRSLIVLNILEKSHQELPTVFNIGLLQPSPVLVIFVLSDYFLIVKKPRQAVVPGCPLLSQPGYGASNLGRSQITCSVMTFSREAWITGRWWFPSHIKIPLCLEVEFDFPKA